MLAPAIRRSRCTKHLSFDSALFRHLTPGACCFTKRLVHPEQTLSSFQLPQKRRAIRPPSRGALPARRRN